MKKCKVKMETAASEIQIESKDEQRAEEVCSQDGGHGGKASMLCFKRRKKAVRAMETKADSHTVDVAIKDPPETGVSGQSQTPRGAWASFKRLVRRRKRSDSSKKPKSHEAKVKSEVSAEDANLSKKRTKSRLKIPCIKFSKGEKRSHHSKIIEDSDCSVKVEREMENLDLKTQTQPDDQVTKAKPTQHINEDVSQRDGNEACESDGSHNVTSERKVISIELGSDAGHSAVQVETLILEKDIETSEEKPSGQPQQADPPETSETEHQPPVISDVPLSPIVPGEQIAEVRSCTPESEPNWTELDSTEVIAEENKPEEYTDLSQESDLQANEINTEKPKFEENKRMEPIAIIITDTEISEFDFKKSKNVPKQFLISTENEQVGIFANDSDFEGRTSEQYETLLMETASSLVKNAIQLSIEQLVNEMISDDNKQSSTVT